jgi:CDP-diacylglycerol--glycerol-3-phosphate 3-phosphatidyltransferase
MRKLADGLTVGRALVGLPLLLALAAGQPALAWILLALGGLSDAADGWLARRAGGGSVWGARLDPLTDKILISAPLLWLGASGGLPLWAVWLLLARELLISGWRANQSSGGPASLGGKAKTILQFAIAAAKERNIHTLLAYIFEHNLPSIQFFQKNGFVNYGVLPEIAIMDQKHYSLGIYGLKVS